MGVNVAIFVGPSSVVGRSVLEDLSVQLCRFTVCVSVQFVFMYLYVRCPVLLYIGLSFVCYVHHIFYAGTT